jgi:hypothetical protein
MNYVVCVIFLILGICGLTWQLQGKKRYTGPKDIDGLLALARYGAQRGEVIDYDAQGPPAPSGFEKEKPVVNVQHVQ